MSARPVQVSLDSALLERLDTDPEVRERGRSAVVRDALRLYLRARERARIDDQIRAAYGDRAKAMLREVEALIGNQTWPDE